MFKNHLKIAWRNLTKNRSYFLINVSGLCVSLVAAFMILLWVQDEYRTDNFHANGDRIFRAKRTIPLEGGVYDVFAGISFPFLEAAVEDQPEVEGFIALSPVSEQNLIVGDLRLRAPGAYTNAGFFEHFSYPVSQGDITQLDTRTEALAISESLAARLWGETWESEAMGSTVQIHDLGDFTVTAIYEDFPPQSSIQSDFYYGLKNYVDRNDWMRVWTNNGMQGALVVRPDADTEQLAVKLDQMLKDHQESENKEGILLQRYGEDYLYSEFDDQAMVSGGRIEYVRLFTIAAIFLLVISCINFINLATAYATRRAAEVGVRKVVGAGRMTLLRQFMVETGIVTALSLGLALVFTLLLLPQVNALTGKSLAVSFSDPLTWGMLLAVFALTTLLAGAYPALVLASFRPINALKGKWREGRKTISLRKGLVVFQFGLSVLLILSAFVVRNQVDYIRTRNLGIQKDFIVSLQHSEELNQHYDALRNELVSSPAIEDVTLAGPSPLDMYASSQGVEWPGKRTEQENIEFALLWSAYNFPELFGIPMADGSFYRESTVDTVNIVVNEKALEVMQMEDPIGKTIQVWGTARNIIGVLKDYNNRSLYEPIQPAVYFLDPGNAGTVFVKLRADRIAEGLEDLEEGYQAIVPGIPFHYEFLDEQHAQTYQAEALTGTLTFWFSLISILISCLGLFGLARFTAEQRTKEIGVRKVLGASVRNITQLLLRDFVALILIAVLIASPLGYYFMRNWLGQFTFNSGINGWYFLLAGGLLLALAVITVCLHAIRAAMANPVNSLRTE